MQVETFQVTGLFGAYDHLIDFAGGQEAAGLDSGPSIVILHGRNGVGKTTMLRMMKGIFDLDFDIFRRVPFASAELKFNSQQKIAVSPSSKHPGLRVSFDGITAELALNDKGPRNESQRKNVKRLKQAFVLATESVNFELIETGRFEARNTEEAEMIDDPRSVVVYERDGERIVVGRRPPRGGLAARVKRFISEAQVNYRRFFSTNEPDLFPRVLEKLSSMETPGNSLQDLQKRLEAIHLQDRKDERLGLAVDDWDYDRLRSLLADMDKTNEYALLVLGEYTDALESRAKERRLVAERLENFEEIAAEFFVDKRVVVHAKDGFRIVSNTEDELREHHLSSGEYHLMYLLVSALVTRRRGTIIAIDEPEMSMHIEWQRKLIRNLLACAAMAEPQFVFATHSPDIAADYPDSVLEL